VKKLIFILMAALLSAVIIPTLQTKTVYGLGDNPSTCVNLYGSEIVSLKLKTKSRTVDVTERHRTNIIADLDDGYTAILKLRSTSVSDSGNMEVGSVWHGNRAFGFASDSCVNGVSSDSFVTIKFEDIIMSTATRGTVQDVEWYSWPLNVAPAYSYTVHWK
jgi:hypothetical protein